MKEEAGGLHVITVHFLWLDADKTLHWHSYLTSNCQLESQKTLKPTGIYDVIKYSKHLSLVVYTTLGSSVNIVC